MAKQFPQVTIPDTEIRRLPSSQTGYEYNLHIALPAEYADTNKTYPTLYSLDPHLTFGISTDVIRLLVHGQEFPKLILIGIGFSGTEKDMESYQARDYVPTGQPDNLEAGGAENFLRFIREDLFLFIGSQYRVDPDDRGFLGYSLAGLFGLYALLHQPDTFSRYIIGSPWTDKDDPQILRFETEFATSHSDLSAQVFISAGSLEPEFVVNNILRLEKAFQNRNYPNLRLQTHIFEGETHLSVVPFNISKGLKVVYQ